MVKTITIKEDAYNVLKSMKRKEESFSDVILKFKNKGEILEGLFGVLSKEGYAHSKKKIREIREELSGDIEKRLYASAR